MQKGTFVDGTYIALQGSETLKPGDVVECRGALSGFMMQMFPLDWLESGVSTLYGLRHANMRVLAVELSANGQFRLQVTPTNVEQAGVGIGVAIAAAAAIGFLAGLQVEYMYLVIKKKVTGTDPFSGDGSSPLGSIVSLVSVVGVVVLGVWLWSTYKQAAA